MVEDPVRFLMIAIGVQINPKDHPPGRGDLSPFYQNPEAERVEQAFRPAVSAGKMPALAAEVLLDHSPLSRSHRVDLL
jgi:hypothetical protein